MPLLQPWFDRQKQKKLAKRKIYSHELNWTIQLPAHFAVRTLAKAQKDYELSARMMGAPAVNSIYKDRNIQVIFSCNYDRFNHFSGAIVPLSGFSRDQIYFSREDCDDRLFRMYSKISNATVDRSSSNIIIAGTGFEQHTFVIRRNGRPILCFEYICQTIREYELSFSILYNNETHRQTMFKCLEESRFS